MPLIDDQFALETLQVENKYFQLMQILMCTVDITTYHCLLCCLKILLIKKKKKGKGAGF